MKEAKEIAKELSKGNVKKACQIKERLLSAEKDAFELEVMEIAKQAILSHLKDGDIKAAKEIKRLFGLPDDLVEDTIQQAVLSSFCDGDVRRVQELKEDLPIPKDLRVKIVDYCASWGKEDMTALMRTVFA